MSNSPKRILFGMTGSIAAYKACDVISTLVQEGFEVQCLITSNTQQFVGRATLEGLTGRPVFDDVFESGRAMDHIALARWADLLVICPATAKTICAMASGTAEDPLGSTVLAFEDSKSVLIFPAMNSQMWAHPATQHAARQLRSWGYKILGPDDGKLACKEVGAGRLLEPQVIVEWIKKEL